MTRPESSSIPSRDYPWGFIYVNRDGSYSHTYEKYFVSQETAIEEAEKTWEEQRSQGYKPKRRIILRLMAQVAAEEIKPKMEVLPWSLVG